MNRRDALKFGLAAPFAAPAIVKAAIDVVGDPWLGRLGMSVVKLDASGFNKTLRARVASEFAEARAISGSRHWRTLTPTENRVYKNSFRSTLAVGPSVKTQMLEHELFEPSCLNEVVA